MSKELKPEKDREGAKTKTKTNSTFYSCWHAFIHSTFHTLGSEQKRCTHEPHSLPPPCQGATTIPAFADQGTVSEMLSNTDLANRYRTQI